MVLISVRYLFYQPMDEKIKNPYMEKALFDWPIVLQYDGHEVFSPERSLIR